MSAIDWETNAWKCLEYTSAYVAVSIHQLQVAKLMGTFLGTQIPRVHHKFPSIAGKSKFMVQYLEPLCRHVTSCNKCLQHGHGLHWFSGCVWCTRVFFLDRGMAGSAYPIRVGPSVFKLVVPIDYPTPRNPGEIAVVHHFPIIQIL